MSGPFPSPSHSAGLLVLRVGLAVILLFHGLAKLQGGIAWMAEPLGAIGLPAWIAYGVYVAEIVAPVLLIVGVLTRFAALTICIDMVMAVILVLRDRVFTINPQGGGWAIELEVLIFVAALTTLLAGGGRFALMGNQRW